jgi:hypothetical protein
MKCKHLYQFWGDVLFGIDAICKFKTEVSTVKWYTIGRITDKVTAQKECLITRRFNISMSVVDCSLFKK